MAFGILSSLHRKPFWISLCEVYFHTCSFSHVTFSSILRGDCKIPPPFLSIGWKSWCRKAACKTMRSRSRQINTNRAFWQKEKFWGLFFFFYNPFYLPSLNCGMTDTKIKDTKPTQNSETMIFFCHFWHQWLSSTNLFICLAGYIFIPCTQPCISLH